MCVCEKYYVLNPAKSNCEYGKDLASIMDDSMIICDEVKESNDKEIKAIPTNFNEKKATCKTQSFYILLAFFLNYFIIIVSC